MAIAVSQIRKVAAAVADEQWGDDPPPLNSYLPPYAPPPTPALTSKSVFSPSIPQRSFPPPLMSELAFSPRSRNSDVFPPAFLERQSTTTSSVKTAQNSEEPQSELPLLLLRPDPNDAEQMNEDRQLCDTVRAMQLQRFLDDCLASAVASQTPIVGGVSHPAPLLPGLPPVAFSTSSCNSEPSDGSRVSLHSPSLSHAPSQAPSQSQSQASSREKQKQGGEFWPVSPRHAHGESLMDQVDEDWIRAQAAKQARASSAGADDGGNHTAMGGNAAGGETEVNETVGEKEDSVAGQSTCPKKEVSGNPGHERPSHGSRASSISSGGVGAIDWVAGSSMNASSNKSSPGLAADDSPHPAIPPSAPASAMYREKPSAPPAFAFPQAQPSTGNAAGELKPLRPPPGAYRRSVSMADVDKGKSYVLSARVTERQSSLKMLSSSVEFPTLRRFADVAGDAARPEDVIWKNLIASAQVHNREISGLREASCNANERVRSGNSACDSSEGLGSLSAKRKPVAVLEGLKEVEEEGNALQVTPREEASREITPRPSTAREATSQEASREITPRPSTAATDVASTPTTDVPWTPTFERDGAMPPSTPQSAAEAAAQRAARKAAQGSCIPPRAQSPRRRNSGLFRKQGSGRLDGPQRQGSGRLDGPQRQGSGRGLAGLASAAAGAAAGAGAGAGRRSISRMSSVKKWRVLNALVKQMNVEDAENETADDGNGGGAGDGGGGGGFTATETHSGAIKSESDKSGWGAPSFSGMSVGGDTEGGGGGQTEEFSAPWSFGSMGDVERFNNTAGGGFADYSVAAASVCQVSPAIFEAHLHLAETMAREEMERQQQQQRQEGRHGKGPRTPRTPRTPRGMGFRSNSRSSSRRQQKSTWDPHHVSVRAAKVKRAIGHVFRKIAAKPLGFLRKLNPACRAT